MGWATVAGRSVGVFRPGSSPTGVVALDSLTRRRVAGRARRTIGAATMMLTLTGCSTVSGWFGSDDGPPQEQVAVLDIVVGQCFAAQPEPTEEVSSMDALPCNTPHRKESFAILHYQPPAGVEGDAFPGNAALAAYADATCAQDFETYVGISYLDSSLFFTYLLPSARGWEQSDDRAVVCFATTTGPELTTSVKESRL